jgi:hypothetical protein
MKKGLMVLGIFLVLTTIFFVSASPFSDFWKKITGQVISTCDEGYICLEYGNSTKEITTDNLVYIMELVSASDTYATIRVTNNLGSNQSKVIIEGSSKIINGLNFTLINADENNLGYSAILKLNEVATASLDCEEGYTCLNSNNPNQNVTISTEAYSLRLVSASDIYATINVVDGSGKNQSAEIIEGDSKIINGLNISLKSADETSSLLSAVLKFTEVIPVITECEEGYTCLNSDDSDIQIVVNNVNYIITLVSASDTYATIRVKNNLGVNQSKMIIEGNSKIINGLNLTLKEANENNLIFSAVFKLNENQVVLNQSETNLTFEEEESGLNCEEEDICLSSNVSSITLKFDDSFYTIFLVSTTDAYVVIQVINEKNVSVNKVIYENQTQLVNGLNLFVKSANENNLIFSAVLKIEEIEENDEEEKGLCESGCLLNEKCLPYGYRTNKNYCSINNILISQIEEGSCVNSFECVSNICADGECTSPGFFLKILNWFKNLFNK